MPRIAGYGGDVYVADLLISNCDTAWNAGQANTVCSLDTSDFKEGTASVVLTNNAGRPVYQLLASQNLSSSLNLAPYSQMMLWAKVSDDTNAAGLIIGGGPTVASTSVACDLPAMAKNVWKYCVATVNTNVAGTFANTTNFNAVIIAAGGSTRPSGSFVLRVDDVRVGRRVAGIKKWTLDTKVAAIDGTGFDSGGNRQFYPGLFQWAGTFEGYKDGPPLTIGTQVGIELRESANSNQAWRGNAIIDGLKPTVSVDGLVEYPYTFTGTGSLDTPTA